MYHLHVLPASLYDMHYRAETVKRGMPAFEDVRHTAAELVSPEPVHWLFVGSRFALSLALL
jgi:hypothetical protein